jgi:hypothetical protein
MRLKDNKEDIIDNKVIDRLYWEEKNISVSDWSIWDNQKIDIRRLITSNNLILSIYNEINR